MEAYFEAKDILNNKTKIISENYLTAVIVVLPSNSTLAERTTLSINKMLGMLGTFINTSYF